MDKKSHALVVNQTHDGIPQKISTQARRDKESGHIWKAYANAPYPLVTAKSVPRRGSHPNARSTSSAGRWRQRAASGRMTNAWTSDDTCDCLYFSSTWKAKMTREMRERRRNGTDHPTRSRGRSAFQVFVPTRNRANSGATRWCTAAKLTAEMNSVWRWSGRCSGRIAAIDGLNRTRRRTAVRK